MQPSTPKKFNILVAALKTPSDPSRGPIGNPTVSRTGFTLQQIVLPNATARIGGPTAVIPPPSAFNHTVAIECGVGEYWDPAVTAPGPFFYKEEVALFDQYITASAEFGAGLGSGTGPAAAIATQLAASLNVYSDIEAVAAGNSVYITSHRPDATLPIKATADESVTFGAPPFVVYAFNGVLMSVGPTYRQTFFITKNVKTQTPPVSLP